MQIPSSRLGTFFLLNFARPHIKIVFKITTLSSAGNVSVSLLCPLIL